MAFTVRLIFLNHQQSKVVVDGIEMMKKAIVMRIKFGKLVSYI